MVEFPRAADPSRPRPWVIAHRGLVGPAPENSLDAFRAAIELGADWVECDVRRDARGDLIVFHDAEVGGAPVGAFTREQLALGLGWAPPLLAEALDLVHGRIGIDLELKEPGLVRQVAGLIRYDADPARILVSSFLEGEVRAASQLLPDLPRGLIRGGWPIRARGGPGLVRQAVACRATHLVLERHRARQRVLRRAAALGLTVLVWTVNRPAQLRRLLFDPRVGGVVTDCARLALEIREQG